MRRRELIALLGGAAAAAWPLAARAQQPAMPVVGFMMAGSRAGLRDDITAFEAGLREMGFAEGQNLALEYRFAEGQFERFPAFASDLVSGGHRSLRLVARREHWRRNGRPRPSRSSFQLARIPSRPESYRALAIPAAM